MLKLGERRFCESAKTLFLRLEGKPGRRVRTTWLQLEPHRGAPQHTKVCIGRDTMNSVLQFGKDTAQLTASAPLRYRANPGMQSRSDTMRRTHMHRRPGLRPGPS